MKLYFFSIALFVLAGCASKTSLIKKRSEASEQSSISTSIDGRDFPSIFQAWEKLTSPTTIDSTTLLAQHDLVWQSIGSWGLKCAESHSMGLCSSFSNESITDALQARARLKQINKHIILLAEIRHHDAANGYLPDDSTWWLRDSNGNRIPKTSGTSTNNYFLLDITNPAFQSQIAKLCRTVIATGVVDGCMFDWWNKETPAHATLIENVRTAVGNTAILIANVNGSQPIKSAPYLNGMYMEGFGAPFFMNWETAKANLLWAQDNLRRPVITAFDAWRNINSDDKAMRFSLAISLIFSDGYFLWGDKLHAHAMHSLLKKTLGQLKDPVVAQASEDGSYKREYENGTAILNPPTNKALIISFTEPRTRASTGEINKQHSLSSGDGDLFLK